MANDEGVFLVEGDETTQLVEGPVYHPLDDLQGGIIFQEEWGEIVYRLSPGQSEPHELLVAAPDQYLWLEDVVARGDDVEIWYSREGGYLFSDTVQTLRVYSFVSGSVTELEEVESGAQFSVSPDLFLGYYGSDGWYGFVLDNDQLIPVTVPLDPVWLDFEDDPSSWAWLPALSDDGSEIAWLETEVVDPDLFRNRLVLSEVASGEITYQISLPDYVDLVHSVDLGDGVVLVNRYGRDESGWLPALLIELGPEPTFTELPIAGNARLVRS